MFIGHFGVGFGAKPLAPRVSLGSLFLAAQFLDLLWPTLLLLGIERVRIVPGATAVTPLVFDYYPVSHSLLAVVAWAGSIGAAYFCARRDRLGAIVVGTLVISHWALDALVHQPDLPIIPGDAFVVGLNAWSSLPLTLVIEVPLFVLGVWLYVRATAPMDASGKWALWGLVCFLLVIYAANIFGGPPPSIEAIAWAGQLQWLLVLWGYWVDKHRHALAPEDSQRHGLHHL
jgi:hypothetical protein